MSHEYAYDEQGQFFPYFILTVVGLGLVPYTYSTFAPNKKSSNKTPLIKDSSYQPPRNGSVEAARRRQAKSERGLKRYGIILAGWALFIYMGYLIVTTQSIAAKIWDPYEILGISMSASEKAIKSHYKKLSLRFHPDKVRPSGNETVETLNERFVEITKAYKALTDEEIRNNFIQYGHPDGKQSFSIGIALPKWIVSEGNMYYVLAVYGLLFGILLPYTVGKWWYGTRRQTKDGVLTESAGNLFIAYDDAATETKLVEILTVGEEMKFLTGGRNERDWNNGEEAIVERKIREAGVPEKEMKVLEEMEGWRRRTIGLLWSYLHRVDLGIEKLEKVKLEVAAAAVTLNNSFHAIGISYGNVQPILSSMRLNQCIVQAIAPDQSPLLQIPYFNNRIVSAVEQDGGKNHWTVQRFMSIPESKRRKLCVGKGLLSDKEYQQAITFAKNLPALHVEDAFFKVMGEKFITPASLVQFVVKLRIIPPGSNAPPVDPKDLVDEDADETDVNALIGRKDGSSKKDNKDTKIMPPTTPLAHAPFFPRDYFPRWHIFLADAKQGKIVVPPQTITNFEKSTDDFAIQTYKVQFQSPPNAGEYTFVMHCVSDSYLGVDTRRSVKLVISDPSKVERIVEDDEISEPDEDSIAGQMHAMKSGGLGGSKKKSKKATEDESSSEEEESDTDGEQGESETDTDTDTDEE